AARSRSRAASRSRSEARSPSSGTVIGPPLLVAAPLALPDGRRRLPVPRSAGRPRPPRVTGTFPGVAVGEGREGDESLLFRSFQGVGDVPQWRGSTAARRARAE